MFLSLWFTSYSQGVLQQVKWATEHKNPGILTSSITLNWLKISFASVKMNYLTVEKFFPWFAPFWNLSHPPLSETHFGDFDSLPRRYSYNPRETKRDLMTNLQWSEVPGIFYTFYFYISLK